MYSYGPPHMAVQKQDDQHEHTSSSYVRIRDVVLKTYLARWTIGRSGERGSGISVLPARYDDDDDIYSKCNVWLYIYIFGLWMTAYIYIYIYIYIYTLSSIDRLFRFITTWQCCYTCEMFQAGIESELRLNQPDILPQSPQETQRKRRDFNDHA